MLIGDYNHNIDDKGRVFLPAKFREELGKHIIITKGFDKCLYIFPREVWEQFAIGLAHLTDSKQEVRRLQRTFIGRALECDVDKQGRIVIPQKLRELVGISSNVVIAGMGNKLEVWDSETFENDELDTEEVQDLLQSYEFSGSSYGI